MPVDLAAIAATLVALAPALVTLFVAYGRYDGGFRDTTVFLHFVGGLFAGMAFSLLSLSILPTGLELFAVGSALVEVLLVGAVVNRKKWHGDPHAVFNGGALASGIAVILALAVAQRYLVPAPSHVDAASLAGLLAQGSGLGFASFAAGAWVGRGVAEHALVKRLAVALAGLLLPFLTLALYVRVGASLGYGSDVVLLADAVALAYGLAALVYGTLHVLPTGLTPETARALRRAVRKDARL